METRAEWRPVYFAGRRIAYFWLALKATFLALITLGLYRFWMKTRLRRYLWSSIRPGGFPLEYHGDPWEKLMGFLAAVCLLAFYIGIVNLVLVYGSFVFFKGDAYGYWLSFLGILPLFWAAKYRARRYFLSRTSWRGIRFHAAPGAWAYARAAAWNWFLTILTLGLLWPRMMFRMEKFRVDRTWWGDRKFEQGGDWRMLRKHTKALIAGVILSILAATVVWSGASAGAPLLLATFFVIGIGYVLFRVAAFREMANRKTLGGIPLASAARPWRILRHYLLGGFLTMAALILLIAGALFAAMRIDPTLILSLDQALTPDLSGGTLWTYIATGLFVYFATFILGTVLLQVLIGFPNLRHYAETLSYEGQDLDSAKRRGGDDLANAEGMADALDIGAAF
jgi:hypothetical protein